MCVQLQSALVGLHKPKCKLSLIFYEAEKTEETDK